MPKRKRGVRGRAKNSRSNANPQLGEKESFFRILDNFIKNARLSNNAQKKFEALFRTHIGTYTRKFELLKSLESYQKNGGRREFKTYLPHGKFRLRVEMLLDDWGHDGGSPSAYLLACIEGKLMDEFSEALDDAIVNYSGEPRLSNLLEVLFIYCLNPEINTQFPSVEFSQLLMVKEPSLVFLKFSSNFPLGVHLPRELEERLLNAEHNVLHHLFSYPISHFSGGEESLRQLFITIINMPDIDWEMLLLEKGGIHGITPFFLMLQLGSLQFFKVALQLLIVKNISEDLGVKIYEAFYEGDEKKHLGMRVNFNELPELKGYIESFLNDREEPEYQEIFKRTQGESKFYYLSSLADGIKDFFDMEGDEDGKVSFLVPLDYTIVRHILPIDKVSSQFFETAILQKLLAYNEENDQLFFKELFEIYPDFLCGFATPAIPSPFFLAMIQGKRELFDFLLSCYYTFLPETERNLERELGHHISEQLFTPYYFSYNRGMNRVSSLFTKRNSPVQQIKSIGFSQLCKKFPEYINIICGELPSILFVLLAEKDFSNLAHFKSNEAVDWHLTCNSSHPLQFVFSRKNKRLTKCFISILFEKNCALSFLLLATEKGIELDVKVTNPYDEKINYFVRQSLEGSEKNIDIETFNKHLNSYSHLADVAVLVELIHAKNVLEAEKKLVKYHELALRKSQISTIAESYGYLANTQKGKILKGPKIQKDEGEDKIQLVEKSEAEPMVVTFLGQPILVEKGGFLVPTSTPNVYVYCDEQFWAGQNMSDINIIDRIKTGQFYLRVAGYAIKATMNVEGFEEPFEKSVPMKFEVSRGDRVYCAKWKEGDCTIYIPCAYVSSGNHDQYENGGNIEFDLYLPEVEEKEFDEVKILV